MVISVSKIVDKVSSDRIDAIVEGSFVSPLAGSGEISFKSRRSCVQVAHSVSIISPALSEALLQSVGELFERRPFGMSVDGFVKKV